MLRFAKVMDGPQEVTLKLEGKIVEVWVSLVEKECRHLRGQKKNVLLDCSEVSYVDNNGVEMLRRVMTEGVATLSCSAFVDSLLKR